MLRVNAILRDLGFVRLRSATGGVEPFFVGPAGPAAHDRQGARYARQVQVEPTRRADRPSCQARSSARARRGGHARSLCSRQSRVPRFFSDGCILCRLLSRPRGLRAATDSRGARRATAPRRTTCRRGRLDARGALGTRRSSRTDAFFAPALGVRPSAIVKTSAVDLARAPGRGCHQRRHRARRGIRDSGGRPGAMLDRRHRADAALGDGCRDPCGGGRAGALRGVRRVPCAVETRT